MRERKHPPIGKLTADFDQAKEAGCIQATCPEMYFGLLTVTNFNPCYECPVWDEQGPKCKTFKQYHSAAQPAARPVQTASRERCPNCGRKIRGNNHELHCKGKR